MNPLADAEKNAREIAKALGAKCPPGWGFCLLIFEFGEPPIDGRSNATYISNAARPEMIKTLREFADRLENGMQPDATTPRN